MHPRTPNSARSEEAGRIRPSCRRRWTCPRTAKRRSSDWNSVQLARNESWNAGRSGRKSAMMHGSTSGRMISTARPRSNHLRLLLPSLLLLRLHHPSRPLRLRWFRQIRRGRRCYPCRPWCCRPSLPQRRLPLLGDLRPLPPVGRPRRQSTLPDNSAHPDIQRSGRRCKDRALRAPPHTCCTPDRYHSSRSRASWTCNRNRSSTMAARCHCRCHTVRRDQSDHSRTRCICRSCTANPSNSSHHRCNRHPVPYSLEGCTN